MLRSVLTSLSKTSTVSRPLSAATYSSSAPDHGDVNFYEMVELFFDRAGLFLFHICLSVWYYIILSTPLET